MGKKTSTILLLTLGIGIIIGFSLNASAQETTSIPSWIKNTAKFWVNGDVSDAEFIKALQWLVSQKILVVPMTTTNSVPLTSETTNQPAKKSVGQFINTDCHRDENINSIVHMTGKYTNGETAYSFIYLQLALLDDKGTVVATGNGDITDIAPYQTKIFETTAIYSGQFSKCEVQVSSAHRLRLKIIC